MIGGFVINRKFTVLSLTGGSCSLNCFYCSAKYISSMLPAPTPEELYKEISRMYERGVKGFLVSGGFNERGELPIKKYLPVMRKAKREMEVIFNVHPGLLDRETIEEMSDAVDIVDYEFAYSTGAYKSKGVKRPREDYLRVLEDLIDYGPKYVVPHLMLGLPSDSDEEVEDVIRLLASYKPYLVNFLVLIPTPSTPSRLLKPMDVARAVRLIELGHALTGGRTSLGCMRPYQLKEELDREVVKRGIVQRIANPHHKVVKEFNLSLYDGCCSLPEEYLGEFKYEADN
ncbi:MAG: radical SAM protein [Candidatus Aramenus sp.]|nr:radical SAM protein [Candidatus Aramenus sp.]